MMEERARLLFAYVCSQEIHYYIVCKSIICNIYSSKNNKYCKNLGYTIIEEHKKLKLREGF